MADDAQQEAARHSQARDCEQQRRQTMRAMAIGAHTPDRNSRNGAPAACIRLAAVPTSAKMGPADCATTSLGSSRRNSMAIAVRIFIGKFENARLRAVGARLACPLSRQDQQRFAHGARNSCREIDGAAVLLRHRRRQRPGRALA